MTAIQCIVALSIAGAAMAQPAAEQYVTLSDQLRFGDTRMVVVGDSHSPTEKRYSLSQSIAFRFDVPLVARGLGFTSASTTGCSVGYPSGSSSGGNVEPGESPPDGEPWHGPGRAKWLLWHEDQPDDTTIGRFSVKPGNYAAGDWISGHAFGGRLVFAHLPDHIETFTVCGRRGSSQGEAVVVSAGSAGIKSSPDVVCPTEGGDPELSWKSADGYNENGRRAMALGAVLYRRGPAGEPLPGFYLETAVAIPGTGPADHARTDGAPSEWWYGNHGLEQREAAFRLRPGQVPVIMVCLGHYDDGSTRAEYAANLRAIRDRFRGAYGPNWFVLVQPWYSPTTTIDRQLWQWEVLQELRAEDDRTVAVSIGAATAWQEFDEFLDASRLHVDTIEGCEFFGDVLWQLLGE